MSERARVRVDLERCVGHGRCYELAPRVFSDDDSGYCVLLREEVSGAEREEAQRAEANCPEQAISVEPLPG